MVVVASPPTAAQSSCVHHKGIPCSSLPSHYAVLLELCLGEDAAQNLAH